MSSSKLLVDALELSIGLVNLSNNKQRRGENDSAPQAPQCAYSYASK